MHQDYTDICSTDRLYHLLVHESGLIYIAGNLDLIPCEYDPMEFMPQIMMELIKLGREYEQGEDISFSVQAFCSRYGLLGFQKALVEKAYDDRSVKFYAGNVLGRKAATAKELDKIFNPFPRELNRQFRRKHRERTAELISEEAGAPPLVEGDYTACESVAWYGRYGIQIYELLHSKQEVDTLVLLPGNAELRYEVGGSTARRHWYFDSLKSACDVWLMEQLTEPHPTIRLCKRCGNAFAATSVRTEYCAPSCRNVANVANSRKRKRLNPKI